MIDIPLVIYGVLLVSGLGFAVVFDARRRARKRRSDIAAQIQDPST
jgi:hypothetical protein